MGVVQLLIWLVAHRDKAAVQGSIGLAKLKDTDVVQVVDKTSQIYERTSVSGSWQNWSNLQPQEWLDK